MKGFLIMSQSPMVMDVKYRHPNESQLASDINDSRATLNGLIMTFVSRLMDFRSPDDVWIDMTPKSRLGFIISIDGGGYQIIVEEDEAQRSLHVLEVCELIKVFNFLPKLKRAVIANAIDHLADLKEAICRFREDVLGLHGEEESSPE